MSHPHKKPPKVIPGGLHYAVFIANQLNYRAIVATLPRYISIASSIMLLSIAYICLYIAQQYSYFVFHLPAFLRFGFGADSTISIHLIRVSSLTINRALSFPLSLFQADNISLCFYSFPCIYECKKTHEQVHI